MNITSEQRDLLTAIVNNKAVLEELLKAASIQQKQVKNLQIKESISLAGITWSKFAEDDSKNAYMLADKAIDCWSLGAKDDWKESPVREILNTKLYKQITEELGEDTLVTIQTDLIGYNGSREYGKCEDKVSIPTLDLYRYNKDNIKTFENGRFWTCTARSPMPDKNCNDTIYINENNKMMYVSANDEIYMHNSSEIMSIRPFIILGADTICERCEERQERDEKP